MLEDQKNNGKISFPDNQFSIHVEQFATEAEKDRQRNSTIHINGLFGDDVDQSDVEEIKKRTDKFEQIFSEVKTKITENIPDCKNFSSHISYHVEKKNFWAIFEFRIENESSEDAVFLEIKSAVKDNFAFSDGNFPYLSYQSNTSSERHLILMGIKSSIQEEDIRKWVFEKLHIDLQVQGITISSKPNKTESEAKRKVLIKFDQKSDGESFMIFCANKANAEAVSYLFENKRLITLNMKKDEREFIQ